MKWELNARAILLGNRMCVFLCLPDIYSIVLDFSHVLNTHQAEVIEIKEE